MEVVEWLNTAPPTILNISIKLESSVESSPTFARVKVIFSLWAPVAFTFDEPVALSNKDVSSVEVIKLSLIVNPTR